MLFAQAWKIPRTLSLGSVIFQLTWNYPSLLPSFLGQWGHQLRDPRLHPSFFRPQIPKALESPWECGRSPAAGVSASQVLQVKLLFSALFCIHSALPRAPLFPSLLYFPPFFASQLEVPLEITWPILFCTETQNVEGTCSTSHLVGGKASTGT